MSMKKNEFTKFIKNKLKKSNSIVDTAAEVGLEAMRCVLEETNNLEAEPEAIAALIEKALYIRHGFEILDLGKLLYPHYLNNEHFPSIEHLINTYCIYLGSVAENLLTTHPDALPETQNHWRKLVQLRDLNQGNYSKDNNL